MNKSNSNSMISRRKLLASLGIAGAAYVSAGVLPALAKGSENAGPPFAASLASVEALRAYEGMADGQQIYLVSYHSGWETANPYIGPSGGGIFIRTTDGALTDDNGLVIAGPGNVRWCRKWDEACGSVDAAWFGAVPDYVSHTVQGTDNHEAIQSALHTGFNVKLGSGIYAVYDKELLFVTAGQMLEGQGKGHAMGSSLASPLDKWQHVSTLMFVGTGQRYVKTHRKLRMSAGDPKDAPLSTAINIEADHVRLKNFAVALSCDYTDNAPRNYGSEWDVGIFVGTRLAYNEEDIALLGYWRVAGRYFDVTRASNIPQITTPDGFTYPESSVASGGDGCVLHRPFGWGGKYGIFVAGAIRGSENQYYVDGAGLATDGRGSFGFSDFAVYDGYLFSVDHHSSYRESDITGNHATDPSGAPLYIDGDRGNGRTLQGMRFFSTRFSSKEAFQGVRLDHCNRIEFYSCFMDPRPNTTYDTTGALLPNNTEIPYTYGKLTATPNTTRVLCIGMSASPLAPYFHSQISNDGGGYSLVGMQNAANSVKHYEIRERLKYKNQIYDVLPNGELVTQAIMPSANVILYLTTAVYTHNMLEYRANGEFINFACVVEWSDLVRASSGIRIRPTVSDMPLPLMDFLGHAQLNRKASTGLDFSAGELFVDVSVLSNRLTLELVKSDGSPWSYSNPIIKTSGRIVISGAYRSQM